MASVAKLYAEYELRKSTIYDKQKREWASCDRVLLSRPLGMCFAAGIHKTKLFVIGKSKKPRAFKGVKVFLVTCRPNKRAWMTQTLMKEWFENHFVSVVSSSQMHFTFATNGYGHSMGM